MHYVASLFIFPVLICGKFLASAPLNPYAPTVQQSVSLPACCITEPFLGFSLLFRVAEVGESSLNLDCTVIQGVWIRVEFIILWFPCLCTQLHRLITVFWSPAGKLFKLLPDTEESQNPSGAAEIQEFLQLHGAGWAGAHQWSCFLWGGGVVS